MEIANKRAIKIVELQEKLEKAKQIITEFVWPCDCTQKQWHKFEIEAAKFAGCSIPKRSSPSENEKKQCS